MAQTNSAALDSLSKQTEVLSEGLKRVTEIIAKVENRLTGIELRAIAIEKDQDKIIRILMEGDGGKNSMQTEVEILKRRVCDLEKKQAEQSARWWQVAMWALGGGGLSAFLTRFIP